MNAKSSGRPPSSARRSWSRKKSSLVSLKMRDASSTAGSWRFGSGSIPTLIVSGCTRPSDPPMWTPISAYVRGRSRSCSRSSNAK